MSFDIPRSACRANTMLNWRSHRRASRSSRELVTSGSPEVISRIDISLPGRTTPPHGGRWPWVIRTVIRRPVEQALLDVGIERIDRMLRQNYRFDWDVELLEFVGEEMAKPHPQGGRLDAPGDRSGWDKPWWADD